MNQLQQFFNDISNLEKENQEIYNLKYAYILDCFKECEKNNLIFTYNKIDNKYIYEDAHCEIFVYHWYKELYKVKIRSINCLIDIEADIPDKDISDMINYLKRTSIEQDENIYINLDTTLFTQVRNKEEEIAKKKLLIGKEIIFFIIDNQIEFIKDTEFKGSYYYEEDDIIIQISFNPDSRYDGFTYLEIYNHNTKQTLYSHHLSHFLIKMLKEYLLNGCAY